MKLYQIEALLSGIEGHWISQRSTYCMRTKQIRMAQFRTCIHIIEDNKEITENSSNSLIGYFYQYYPLTNRSSIYYYDITKIEPLYIQGKIKKKQAHQLEHYDFIFKNSHLKIQLNQNCVHYTEYIYFISSKFYISIIIIKSNDHYNAISFHSYIKTNIKS